MSNLQNRVTKLEQQLANDQCTCGSKNSVIRFASDPPPEIPVEVCPTHGRREHVVKFIDWPLPRSLRDQ